MEHTTEINKLHSRRENHETIIVTIWHYSRYSDKPYSTKNLLFLVSSSVTSHTLNSLNIGWQWHTGLSCIVVWCMQYREYYETLQCLYNSLLKCSADEPHLYVIASRVGHLRTFMEQTCAAAAAAVAAAASKRPEVTSRSRDDVITKVSHVTSSPRMTTLTSTSVIQRTEEESDDEESGDSVSPKCVGTTQPDAPMTQLLRRRSDSASTATSTSSSMSMSLLSAVASAILRRHRQTWRDRSDLETWPWKRPQRHVEGADWCKAKFAVNVWTGRHNNRNARVDRQLICE